jgi:hypothetical protein
MDCSGRFWIAMAVAFCAGSPAVAGTIPPGEMERLEYHTTDIGLRIDFHGQSPSGSILAAICTAVTRGPRTSGIETRAH